ncbi:MAG TPA: Asp-tRNA(Asn)/Glu-tRNA(Gln) amidotransferase subunit GatC [Stellaceae bacterium]
MALDKTIVARIATLARIKVPDRDLESLAGELTQIMTWIEQLNEVDVTDVEPMTSVVHQTMPMRADKVTDGGDRDAILKNAPQAARGFFAVPKVVE